MATTDDILTPPQRQVGDWMWKTSAFSRKNATQVDSDATAGQAASMAAAAQDEANAKVNNANAAMGATPKQMTQQDVANVVNAGLTTLGMKPVMNAAVSGDTATDGAAAAKGGKIENTATYDQLLEALDARREQRKADRKKERRDHLFASIGDGISALAGLVSAGVTGAPSVYDPKTNMAAKAQERWDRIYKQRNEDYADQKDYLEVLKAKRADEIANMNAWYKQEVVKQRAEKTSAELARIQAQINRLAAQGEVEEARALYYEAMTKYNEARTNGLIIDNKYKPQLNESLIHQRDASASAAQARANNQGQGTTTTTTREETDAYGNTKTVKTTQSKQPGTSTEERKPLPKGQTAKKKLP